MNRLAELKAAQDDPPEEKKKAVVESPREGGGATAVKFEDEEDNTDPEEKALQLIAQIQASNQRIRNLTADLRVKSAAFRESFDPDGDGSQTELRKIADQVTAEGKKAKSGLDLLKLQTQKLEARGAEFNPAVIRIQQNQYTYLAKSFQQAITEYQTVTNENEQMLKEQTIRRIKLKYKNQDKTTISDQQAEQLAVEVLQMGKQDSILQQSKDTLYAILETRKDLLKIQQSLRELLELFNDLSTLLNEQSLLMDQIHQNVQHSIEYVEKGREELQKAKKYQKGSRKKMVWLVIFIVIIFLFVAASVLGASIPMPGRSTAGAPTTRTTR